MVANFGSGIEILLKPFLGSIDIAPRGEAKLSSAHLGFTRAIWIENAHRRVNAVHPPWASTKI
jgi:hypothetical protein